MVFDIQIRKLLPRAFWPSSRKKVIEIFQVRDIKSFLSFAFRLLLSKWYVIRLLDVIIGLKRLVKSEDSLFR